MRRIIFVRLILVLILVFIVVGCTNKIPETTFIKETIPLADLENNTINPLENNPINRSNSINDSNNLNGSNNVNGFNNIDGIENITLDYLKNNKNEENSDFNKKSINFFNSIPSCEEKNEVLNVSPIKYGDFQTIIPLGNLNPSGHTFPTDHIYMMIRRAYENNKDVGTVNVDLYMPGDSWITEITVTEHLSEKPILKDYDLVFYPCKELKFRFGHITSLSEELLSQFNVEKQCDNEYETGNKRFKRCSVKNLNIKVNSGQKIGTVGGNPNQNALDIWGNDLRVEELEFANPNRWYGEVRHTVCPLNYFTEKEKNKLYSLLGGFDNNQRVIEPRCGTIEQDVKGTAQGVWFVKGTKNTYPEDPHLALVLNNIDPTINVFSVGTSISNLESKTYCFSPESTEDVNVAFSKVKPGRLYCYEQSNWNFVMMLELVDEDTLKIEKQSGNRCNGQFKFVNAVLFER